MQEYGQNIKIKVIGTGGLGIRAMRTVSSLIESDIVDFVGMDTCGASDDVILIGSGEEMERGYSTDELGSRAALLSAKSITEFLSDANLLIIITGMGGRTGTGAVPVIAEIASKLNIYTMVITYLPGKNEEDWIKDMISAALESIQKHANAIIIEEQDVIKKLYPWNEAANPYPLALAEVAAMIILTFTVQGVMNIDLNDYINAFKGGGLSGVAIGRGNGGNAILKAMNYAVDGYMDKRNIINARKIICIIMTRTEDVSIGMCYDAMKILRDGMAEDTLLIYSNYVIPDLGNDVEVVLFGSCYNGDISPYL